MLLGESGNKQKRTEQMKYDEWQLLLQDGYKQVGKEEAVKAILGLCSESLFQSIHFQTTLEHKHDLEESEQTTESDEGWQCV